ncbi:MAG TPA: NAD-dependent protein deacylase [Clostridia bacterium]|nr:NAD-dependent protein deacylase [Clostridia bacterium]
MQTLKLLKETNKIVFFGGAGTSTESGIPDFRSAGGIYSKAPEEWLSSTYLYRHSEDFYDFYKKTMLYPDAKPNRGHEILQEWEEKGKLLGIITQNVDGLHQKAASKNVVEIHGSVERNYCELCRKRYSLQDVIDQEGIPYCSCGQMIRPDVVLYGEMLNDRVVQKATNLLRKAELLIVGGTSLVVYPAAGMLQYFGGDHIIMINKGSTSYDRRANLVLRNGFSEDMIYLDKEMFK